MYFPFVGRSHVFRRSREVLKPNEHFFCNYVALARRTAQKPRHQTSSRPGLFAEIGDKTIATTHFADVLAGASVDLIAFSEVTDLPPIVGEQTVRKTISHIVAAPVPKTIEIGQFLSLRSDSFLSSGIQKI